MLSKNEVFEIQKEKFNKKNVFSKVYCEKVNILESNKIICKSLAKYYINNIFWCEDCMKMHKNNLKKRKEKAIKNYNDFNKKIKKKENIL